MFAATFATPVSNGFTKALGEAVELLEDSVLLVGLAIPVAMLVAFVI